MFKQQGGITLVALVITVIVLLILAGVALSMITMDGTGIFDKTKEAAEKYNNEAEKENAYIQQLVNQINNYTNSETSGD